MTVDDFEIGEEVIFVKPDVLPEDIDWPNYLTPHLGKVVKIVSKNPDLDIPFQILVPGVESLWWMIPSCFQKFSKSPIEEFNNSILSANRKRDENLKKLFGFE